MYICTCVLYVQASPHCFSADNSVPICTFGPPNWEKVVPIWSLFCQKMSYVFEKMVPIWALLGTFFVLRPEFSALLSVDVIYIAN